MMINSLRRQLIGINGLLREVSNRFNRSRKTFLVNTANG
jgi:hypothetical protein